MTKKLRYLCTLLLLAVASVAWAADTWEKTDASNLKTGDVVVIVDQTSSTAMSNNKGTSSAPSATSVTLSTDKSKITSNVDATLQWTVTVSNGSYKFAVGTDYLYCTNSNNGVRVGTIANNDFTISEGFLKNTGTSRYVGVYSSQDWRCYTTIHDNIKATEIAFYKKAGPVDPNVAISSNNVKIGATLAISYPSDLTSISFSSSNEPIATVDDSGIITGVAEGQAIIYATWTATERYNAGTKSFEITVEDPNGPGMSAENPYTVAQARTAIDNNVGIKDVYATGIVSAIVTEYNSQFDNITYNISDDGTAEADQLQIYRGTGNSTTSASVIKVGDKVVVTGSLKKYNDTYEFEAGSVLVSLEPSSDPYISAPDVVELAYDATEGEIEVSIENAAVAILGGSVEEGCDWITDLNTSVSPVTFKTTVNESSDPREATITFTGGGASKVVTIIQAGAPVVYTTISDMFEAATSFGNKATDVLVKFDGWVVTGASINNVFVSDGTHGFIIYAKDHGFKVDDVLTSEEPISCKLQLYNGSAEITALTASTSGLTITTNEGGDTYAIITKEELSGVNTGALICYDDLTCTKDGNNCYLTDGTTTLKVFTTLYSDALSKFEDGKKYTVTGIYQQFNNNQGETKEILPRYASDIKEEALPTLFFEVEIGESGYATLYYSDVNLAIPEGVTVSYVSDLSGKQLVTKPITEVIPAGTAVILQGEPNTYEFNVTDAEATAITGNMLFGTDENQPVYVDGDCYYYKLVEQDGVVGFWWGAEDGGQFENVANKAYLKVDKTYFDSASPAKVFYLFGGDGGVSTGINNVEKIAEGAAIYNLNGVRVNKMQKGVYVVNGKKVVIK